MKSHGRHGLAVLRLVAFLCTLVYGDAQAQLPHTAFLSFDGQNDVATVPTSTPLSPTAQITVEAWVRAVSLPNTKNQARVVSKTGSYELTLSTGDTGCGFGTQGAVQWRATIAGVDGRICGGTISPGVWHHIAGTYDGAVFALYLDGARVATANRTGSIAVTANAVRFGNTALLDRPLDGALDEVRIWRRALSQSQLQAQAGSTLTGSEIDLAGYFRLDEGSGQTVLDLTSNANNGVLGATAAVETSDPARSGGGGGPQNTAPDVDAGPDQFIQWPADTVQLQGRVTDDGLPSGTLTYRWTRTSGPSSVTFGNATALQTSARFPMPGTYVLQLEASDGALADTDTLQVQVADQQQTITSLEVLPRFISLGVSQTQAFTATARDALGNPVAVNVTWSASGGSVSTTGLYSAPSSAGTFTVRATAGGVTRLATVDVTSPAPPWPTAGWASATPASMGLDANSLAQARDFALTYGGSGMITRGGRVVMSWGSTTLRYDVKSTTKSIGSILVGLAVGEGRIALDDAAQIHLSSIGVPPTSNASTGWLDDITLLQLGTHTSGFDKSGGYTALRFEPGTGWFYSDGAPNWLADVLTNSYRTDLNTIAFSRAFTPMGVTTNDLRWRLNAYRETTLNGVTRREFGSGISLNVDAMARIGYLFLRRGRWEGQRVLPDSFVQQVQRPQPEVVGLPVRDGRVPETTNHYGYLWWTNADSALSNMPRDAYWAHGLGESFILVIPSLDLVIARAGNAWVSGVERSDYAQYAPFFSPIVAAVIAKVSVPTVIGMTQSAAANAIDQAGLAISAITFQASSTVPAGQVISQSPSQGTQVARNTGVRLVISRPNPDQRRWPTWAQTATHREAVTKPTEPRRTPGSAHVASR